MFLKDIANPSFKIVFQFDYFRSTKICIQYFPTSSISSIHLFKFQYLLQIFHICFNTLLFLCYLYLISIHPSIIYTAYPLEGRGGAGVDPSWHWASGGVHPGQVASLSQGCI